MNNAVLCIVHGLHEGRCGTVQLQDVQMAAATTTSSTQDKMNARGVCAMSSRHWFAAVLCKMEITSRKYYSFCVISSMI